MDLDDATTYKDRVGPDKPRRSTSVIETWQPLSIGTTNLCCIFEAAVVRTNAFIPTEPRLHNTFEAVAARRVNFPANKSEE